MTGAQPSPDDALVARLRDLGPHIDWPTGASNPDLAVRVGLAVAVDRPTPVTGSGWSRWRPARRALVLALVAVLALAGLAAALALGLPGLRIRLVEPSTSLPPVTTPGPTTTADTTVPGSRLGLGRRVALEDAERLTRRPIGLPVGTGLGRPDVVYIDEGRADQVALVWAVSDSLPATREAGVGLLLMRFDGLVDEGFYEKTIGSGTSVEAVDVGVLGGYWISGDPHLFFYRDAAGESIDDDRRWVGDALIWSDGRWTYRLESALDRDAAIDLAESIAVR